MKKLLTTIFLSMLFLTNISIAESYSDSLKPGIKEYFEFKFTEAIEILTPMAANGDDEAQLYLGVIYRNGDGVEKDNFKAASLFKKSAEQGNAWSQNHLAWMYIDGKGVLKDYKEAKYWFQKAYANDDASIRANAKEAWDSLELWKY